MGIDLVDIVRVERLLRRHPERALNRLLTNQEQSYCMAAARPAQHVAARIAAKEASYKALQQAGNARGVGWLDSEVVLDAHGKPNLLWHGVAERAASHLCVSSAIMSLTHSDSTAAAVVILLGEVT